MTSKNLARVEQLREQIQSQKDIIEECADALDCFFNKPTAYVSDESLDSPDGVSYSVPMPYILQGIRQWQAAARLKKIDLEKELEALNQ